MNSGHWSIRAHAACTTVAWCCVLNILWITFTLLGGVVLGVGPATVAACIAVRRRVQGESLRFTDFAAIWRKEFIRGTAVVLPITAVTAVLIVNYAFFAALGSEAGAVRVITLIALVLAIAAGAYIGPMYAFYDLPLRSYLPRALRFALARPVPTVLLLLVFGACVFATVQAPVLLVTVSIGAWLHTSTWLCIRFFTENEDRLASTEPDPRPLPERALPHQPLRIR